MEFSWTIFTVVAAVNLAWLGLMFVVQKKDKNLPPRLSLIPETNQKFLYMQDFWTMTWGDTVGLTLIYTAFVHLAANGCMEIRHWIAFVMLATIFSFQFARMCTSKEHKPDWGFPDIGKISWGGIIHLSYFGVGVAMNMLCVWFADYLSGQILIVLFSGVMFYAVCLIEDIRSGNFDPLKRI